MRKPRKKPKTIRVYERFFAMKKYELEKKYPKGHRFFPWLYMVMVLPWVLVWRWLRRDWKLFLYFGIWAAIVSCEVWVPYLLGFIAWGTEKSKYWFSIGSAMWAWWALPGTPFIAICLALTIATEAVVKAVKKRLKARREAKKNKQS